MNLFFKTYFHTFAVIIMVSCISIKASVENRTSNPRRRLQGNNYAPRYYASMHPVYRSPLGQLYAPQGLQGQQARLSSNQVPGNLVLTDPVSNLFYGIPPLGSVLPSVADAALMTVDAARSVVSPTIQAIYDANQYAYTGAQSATEIVEDFNDYQKNPTDDNLGEFLDTVKNNVSAIEEVVDSGATLDAQKQFLLQQQHLIERQIKELEATNSLSGFTNSTISDHNINVSKKPNRFTQLEAYVREQEQFRKKNIETKTPTTLSADEVPPPMMLSGMRSTNTTGKNSGQQPAEGAKLFRRLTAVTAYNDESDLNLKTTKNVSHVPEQQSIIVTADDKSKTPESESGAVNFDSSTEEAVLERSETKGVLPPLSETKKNAFNKNDAELTEPTNTTIHSVDINSLSEITLKTPEKLTGSTGFPEESSQTSYEFRRMPAEIVAKGTNKQDSSHNNMSQESALSPIVEGCYTHNVAYHAIPLSITLQSSLGACQYACLSTYTCKAFTYYPYPRLLCKVFVTDLDSYLDPSAISATRACVSETGNINVDASLKSQQQPHMNLPSTSGVRSATGTLTQQRLRAPLNIALDNIGRSISSVGISPLYPVVTDPAIATGFYGSAPASALRGQSTMPYGAVAASGAYMTPSQIVSPGITTPANTLMSGMASTPPVVVPTTDANIFQTTQAVMEAGSALMDAFPVEQLLDTGADLYQSGFFRERGVRPLSTPGLAVEKKDVLPPPGVGRPSVSCHREGMTCCVPLKAAPDWDNKPPFLNKDASKPCRAIFVSAKNAVCATSAFDNESCGITKLEVGNLIIYKNVLTIPNRISNNAICECHVDNGKNPESAPKGDEDADKVVKSFATWEYSINALENAEKRAETGDKIVQGLSSAVAWTNMINKQGSAALDHLQQQTAYTH